MKKDSTFRYLNPPLHGTADCYPLTALGQALRNAGIESFENLQGRSLIFASKVFSKLRLPHRLAWSGDDLVFVAFMGFSESRTLPFSLWTEIIPYCFDCWPANYDRWSSFFRRHRIRLSFFSARQSAEYFAQGMEEMRSVWLPEATTPGDYRCAIPLSKRNIDILELGRKNDRFHSNVAAHLSRREKNHLFERIKGEIIFPDRSSLVAGLEDTKISVCFPCSQTHPARSGSVETVTQRYFESMAAKCVLLGHCPNELSDLFGYNPVIEVDSGHETEQIDTILADISNYEELVENNYRRLLEVGTWESRVPDILREIANITRAPLTSSNISASAA